MLDILQLIADRKFSRAMKALAEDPSLIKATALDDPMREGVFHEAASGGDVDFMKYLIGLGGDFDRPAPARHYITPLCEAADVGDNAMIELLCEKGARVDGADSTALSPLMIAAKSAMDTSVDLLLRCGADPNRLGFVQRYLPVDFANWQDSEKCRKLIRARNGRSVTDEYDWQSQPGYPIIVTVSNEVGAVFPLQLVTSTDNTSIRVAQVRTKPHSMYVFTDELHAHGRKELAFFLVSTWGVLAEYRDGASAQSFPIDVLRALGRLVKQGSLRVQEGDLFERSSPLLNHLKWPDGVSAMLAVNHNIKEVGVSSETTEGSDDIVEILVLVPLFEGGVWSKGPKYLTKVLADMRKARLQKIALVDPLRAFTA